jgi:peptide deformylase
MKRLPLAYFGDPILRVKAKPVLLTEIKKPAFQKLITLMFFTLRGEGGVGLAAPQIGLSLRLTVIKNGANSPRIVLINPKIESHSKTQKQDWEGCLSLPLVRGLVPRYVKIVVSYYDENGIKRRKTINRFSEARVFQHEIDHLNGVLYVDRMRDMKSLSTLDEYVKGVLGK